MAVAFQRVRRGDGGLNLRASSTGGLRFRLRLHSHKGVQMENGGGPPLSFAISELQAELCVGAVVVGVRADLAVIRQAHG